MCRTMTSAQLPEHELLSRSVTLHLSGATLTSALAKLAGDYEIPIGLERALADDDGVRLEINVEARPLSEVLETIVKQEPAYRWELRDGVINFTPTKVRSPFLEALLKLQISHFATNKELTRFQLRNSILRLPEVNALMLAESVKLDRFSDNASLNPATSQLHVNATGTDLRSLLNKVIRETGYKTWVVEMTGQEKNRLAFSF